MRARFVPLLLAAYGAACAEPQPPPPPDQGIIDSLTITAQPGTPSQQAVPGTLELGIASPRDGFLHVPLTYNHTIKTPLIVALHPGGMNSEFWNEYRFVADGYGAALLAIDSRFITWDFLTSAQWGPDISFLNDALQFTFDRVNVDPDRISIMGHLDGATIAIPIGIANAGLFDNIIAFSPGVLITPFTRGYPKIFVSHGTNDAEVSTEKVNQEIVVSLRNAGFEVELMLFNGGRSIPSAVALRGFDIATQQR